MTTIALPADWVLPQLPQGKVVIALSELLPLLPADLLLQPAQLCHELDTITLPLHELIAAIPPETLAMEGQAVVSVDSEEFHQLPNLFEEPAAQEPRPEPAPAAPVTPVNSPASAPLVSPAAPTHPGSCVTLKMSSLVAGMPDCVFVCPRAKLWEIVNPDLQVSLPLEPLLPQLKLARLALPLAVVIEAMPPSLFARPLPPVQGEVVPLPLQEIISQLSPSLFVAQARQTPQETLQIDEEEIPTPFEEKTPAPEVSAPTPPPKAEVSAEALEDESFAVFSEKTATPVPQPAELIVKEPETPPAEPSKNAPVPQGTQFLVDLNHCSIEDLQKLHRVGPALAQRIIEFRQARGRIQSLEELREVPGIGRKTFRALAGPDPRKLNRLLGVEHDRELTLQEIIHHLAALPGVEGCVLALGDGLLLTGEVPAPFDRNTTSVFGPQLFKRIARHTRELGVGEVSHVTIFAESQPMSVFSAGDVYLVVVHNSRRYSRALLHRCKRISHEIARLCSSRAIV